jgi:hypothetical protein
MRFLAFVVIAMTGCAQYATYGYQYRVTQQFGGGDQPDAISTDARQLLATAHTVAFYPPDYCVNTDVSDHKAKDMRATCGVAMTQLERAAEQAGYEVVSWQNLKGPGQRPIDFARESNVDVLFEINQFEPGELSDSDIQRTLTFFDHGDHGDAPLAVSNSVAQTCQEYALQRDPAQTAALTGVIDIKTVAVADGRVRWEYRKTLSSSLGRTYPQVTFRDQIKPNKLAMALSVAGGVAVGVGLALFVVEQSTMNDPTTGETKFDSGGWSTGLLIGGALAIVAGIGAQYGLGGEKPVPEDVLCNGKLAVSDTPQPATVTVGPLSAEHTFQDKTESDPLAKARDQIRSTMINEFIGALKAARATPQ